jgi:plastocyanin
MLRRAGLVAVVLVLLSTGSVSAATATVTITRTAFTPNTQTVTLGNAVQWKNVTGRKHTATPVVNWSWGGVTVRAGRTSAAVYPTQAGSWPYFCSLHPSRHRGTIAVPLTIDPVAGTTSTLFKLTLGTVVAPGVSVHEVYARLNGGAWQLRASTQAPTWSLLFTSAGTWEVRTRMRWMLGGGTSDYSPITTLTVF